MKSLPTHVPDGERIFTNIGLLGAWTHVTCYRHRSTRCSSERAPWMTTWIELLLQKWPFSVSEGIHRILWNEKHATVPCPKLNYSSPHISLCEWLHFNIILPSTPKMFKGSFRLRNFWRNFVHIYHFPSAYHVPQWPHSPELIIPIVSDEQNKLYSSAFIFIRPVLLPHS
jgi:hypothetical protein